jgi:hypothetical protein
MNQCIGALKKIPIIHLHGYLGPLPEFGPKEEIVAFGPPLNDEVYFADCIDRAAPRIVVVHEAQAETNDFDRARKLLQSVNQVVMLGFGYGERNLSRLDIKRWPVTLYGTTFGLTDSEINHAITMPFREAGGHSLNIGQSKWGTREFLRNNLPIFRAPA